MRMRGLRWWMIGLIMLGSIVNYLTRSTLAVAAPTILQDLRITAQQYSWIVGAFQATIMPYKFRWCDLYSSQMGNWGVHYFDMIRWLTGEFAPASVSAT